MSNHRVIKIIGVVCIMFFVLPHVTLAEQTQGSKDLYFVEPGPIRKGTLYVDGSVIELQGQIVTRPMVGSDPTNVTQEEFKRAVLDARKAFENDPNKIVVSPDGPRSGFNIVFNVSNPPAGAAAALESVATYLENLFEDSCTITINVGFASLPPGVIGATSVIYAGALTWLSARNGLFNDMDYDDTIQNWLPSGNTIPVRYNYNSSTVTDEDRVWFSVANYNAAIGTYLAASANMTFSTNFAFDYDPSNGVSGGTMCFQTTAAHETGHALGFVSGADFRVYDMEVLDIYRFQNTDGSGDYNPDTLPEFQTTPRLVWKDNGTTYDDVNSDLIEVEYGMADGNPAQASHFTTGLYALMEPYQSLGETYYPDFCKEPDLVMFDAIGWDYVDTVTMYYTLTINIIGNGSVEKDPDLPIYQEGTVVTLTAIPDPGWAFHHWSGGASGPNNPVDIIMDSDKTVTAHFVFQAIEENQDATIEAAYLNVFPNPFSEKVNIAYSTGNSAIDGSVLKIYDVTGKLVKDFHHLITQPVNNIIWDSRDDSGEKVSSGVYFLKFETGDFRETRRLLLVK